MYNVQFHLSTFDFRLLTFTNNPERPSVEAEGVASAEKGKKNNNQSQFSILNSQFSIHQ